MNERVVSLLEDLWRRTFFEHIGQREHVDRSVIAWAAMKASDCVSHAVACSDLLFLFLPDLPTPRSEHASVGEHSHWYAATSEIERLGPFRTQAAAWRALRRQDAAPNKPGDRVWPEEEEDQPRVAQDDDPKEYHPGVEWDWRSFQTAPMVNADSPGILSGSHVLLSSVAADLRLLLHTLRLCMPEAQAEATCQDIYDLTISYLFPTETKAP